METITEQTIEEQKKEFQRFLDNILNEPYTSKIDLNDDGLITYAKVNSQEIIDKSQLDHLSEVADSYRHDYQISRSGAGIKIEFKLIEE